MTEVLKIPALILVFLAMHPELLIIGAIIAGIAIYIDQKKKRERNK